MTNEEKVKLFKMADYLKKKMEDRPWDAHTYAEEYIGAQAMLDAVGIYTEYIQWSRMNNLIEEVYQETIEDGKQKLEFIKAE